MLVINFAGSDRSGKTEIANALAEKLGISYFKNQQEIANFKTDESYFRNVLRYGCPILLDFIQQTGTSVIFDRNYACEWVYSQAMDRETYPRDLRWLDDEYAKLGAITIVCARKSYEGIIDDAFPDDLNSKKLAEINQLYKEFCLWSNCKSFILYVDDEDLDREISDIMDFLNPVLQERENAVVR